MARADGPHDAFEALEEGGVARRVVHHREAPVVDGFHPVRLAPCEAGADGQERVLPSVRALATQPRHAPVDGRAVGLLQQLAVKRSRGC